MARKSNVPEGTIMVNKWPGKCRVCGCDVAAFKGKAYKSYKWHTYCHPCWGNTKGKTPTPTPVPAIKPVEIATPQQPQQHPGSNHLACEYDSWGDFMRAALGSSHLANDDRKSRAIDDRDDPWSGVATWDNAMDLVNRGWPDGWSKVKEIASQIGEAVASKTTTVETAMAESGDELDVPLLLTGEPECWYNYPLVEHKAQGGRIVKVAVSLSASGGVDKSAIINRGAAALAVIDALENNGYRVELTILQTVREEGASDRISVSFVAKESDQPIDVDRLAFAVVHPAMLRRVVFSLEETLGREIGRKFGFKKHGGYGVPEKYPDPSKFDIYIDMLHLSGPWQSLEGATSQALEALTKTGLLQMRAGE